MEVRISEEMHFGIFTYFYGNVDSRAAAAQGAQELQASNLIICSSCSAFARLVSPYHCLVCESGVLRPRSTAARVSTELFSDFAYRFQRPQPPACRRCYARARCGRPGMASSDGGSGVGHTMDLCAIVMAFVSLASSAGIAGLILRQHEVFKCVRACGHACVPSSLSDRFCVVAWVW